MDQMVDLNRLREFEDELGVDVVLELVDLFLEDTPPQLAAMDTALGIKDGTRLERVAHSLKGSGSNLGLLTFAGQAGDLEKHARAHGCAHAPERVAQLQAEFERIGEILRRYRQQLATRV